MSPVVSAGLKWKRRRSESERTEIGLCHPKVRNHPGMHATGTNALEAKVRGKSQMNPPDCAASTLRTSRPINAEIQEKAKLTPSSSKIPSRNSNGVPPGRKP